jgi:hypothetical protein
MTALIDCNAAALERPPPIRPLRVRQAGSAFRVSGSGISLEIIAPVTPADLDALIETVRLWEDFLCRR